MRNSVIMAAQDFTQVNKKNSESMDKKFSENKL